MNSEKYTLIDGVFEPTAAKEILMTLFSNKIQFHHIQNFISIERNGEQEVFALQRISALKSDQEQLKLVLNDARKENKRVAVSTIVHLTFID